MTVNFGRDAWLFEHDKAVAFAVRLDGIMMTPVEGYDYLVVKVGMYGEEANSYLELLGHEVILP